MSLGDFLKSLAGREAQPRTKIELLPANVSPADIAGKDIVANEHYVRFWVRSMFLRNDRKWFTRRYPLLYSLVKLNFGSSAVELANVSGKNRLDIKQADLGKLVLENGELTRLIPFNGGTVDIDCGLVSMRSDNMIQKFAAVVSDFAGKLVQPQIAKIADIASSVASGVQDLLGAGEAETELYYSGAFTARGGPASPLKSGFIFLSEQVDGTYRPDQLYVTPEGLRYGANREKLQAQDYILLAIERRETRDDWMDLTAIREPFEAALDAKFNGEKEKATQFLRQAVLAALKSPDLTRLDRNRIAKALPDYLNDSGGGTPPTRALEGAGGGIDHIGAALEAVSLEQARGLPDYEEDYALSLSAAPASEKPAMRQLAEGE